MIKSKPTEAWHVVGYGDCPECTCWSCGVRLDGKLVRHSIGFGSVERFRPGSPFRTTICKGSGVRVAKDRRKG